MCAAKQSIFFIGLGGGSLGGTMPEGWVEYSKTGSAADPGYGRHWRLDNGARARCML